MTAVPYAENEMFLQNWKYEDVATTISFNEGYQNNKQISDLERNYGAASLGD